MSRFQYQDWLKIVYSWGFFKHCSDRFVDLFPNSVDALLKLDEDRVITGSENRLISMVGILPNKIIQPIAEHSEYPIERLGITIVISFSLNYYWNSAELIELLTYTVMQADRELRLLLSSCSV
ncbi:WD repeat-containing protein 55-like isoform X3 [Coffea arabica]